MHKKLLVTGCGRSGTRYITVLLRQLGLDIGHETMRKDGIASWYSVVAAERTPWGQQLTHLYQFEQIFHQVRHPLSVIPSVCSFDDASWQFISEYIPIDLEEPNLLKGAKYWYSWNCEAEKKAHWRYKIEDIHTNFDEFCERLSIFPNYDLLENIPTDVNTRQYGKWFHYHDEFLDRFRMLPVLTLRNLLKFPGRGIKSPALTWDDLRCLDSDFYLKIKEKAEEYGYGY